MKMDVGLVIAQSQIKLMHQCPIHKKVIIQRMLEDILYNKPVAYLLATVPKSEIVNLLPKLVSQNLTTKAAIESELGGSLKRI